MEKPPKYDRFDFLPLFVSLFLSLIFGFFFMYVSSIIAFRVKDFGAEECGVQLVQLFGFASVLSILTSFMAANLAVNLRLSPAVLGFCLLLSFNIKVMSKLMQHPTSVEHYSLPDLSCNKALDTTMKELISKDHISSELLKLHHPGLWDLDEIGAFIFDVGIWGDTSTRSGTASADEETKRVNEIMRKMDESYIKLMIAHSKSFDWKSKMEKDERIKKALLFYNNKYDGNSVMGLVKLFRDKFVHRNNVKIHDTYAVLKENGEFSEPKFVMHFLTTYPEAIIYLFNFVACYDVRSLDWIRNKHCRLYSETLAIRMHFDV